MISAAASPETQGECIDALTHPACLPADRVLCKVLGQAAVHAAFAGFTDCTVGQLSNHYGGGLASLQLP